MSETVSYVDAVFGGKPVRFELYRDGATVKRLEDAVGSVSACWGRFGSGDWTMGDVRAVLALAHPTALAALGRVVDGYHRGPVPAERMAASLAEMHRLIGREPAPLPANPSRVPRGIEPDVIDAVLALRPLATYAPLAGAILSAAFLGLPPAAARFDENARLTAEPEKPGEAA